MTTVCTSEENLMKGFEMQSPEFYRVSTALNVNELYIIKEFFRLDRIKKCNDSIYSIAPMRRKLVHICYKFENMSYSLW